MTVLFKIKANIAEPNFVIEDPTHFLVSLELFRDYEIPFVSLPYSDEPDPNSLRHKGYYCHFGLTDRDSYFQSDEEICMTDVMLWSKAAQIIQESYATTGKLKEISIRMCEETGTISLL